MYNTIHRLRTDGMMSPFPEVLWGGIGLETSAWTDKGSELDYNTNFS